MFCDIYNHHPRQLDDDDERQIGVTLSSKGEDNKLDEELELVVLGPIATKRSLGNNLFILEKEASSIAFLRWISSFTNNASYCCMTSIDE